MNSFITLLLLAFAVSLDSFSTGLTYGLRKMGMPLKSVFIISLCSGVSLLLAMGLGNILSAFIPEYWTGRIGGTILILLGIWVLYQFFVPAKDAPLSDTLFKIEIKSLGVVIQILRTPLQADFDRSGTITGIEAFFLGLALSLDAFGAGIGAALLGYSPLILSLSVVMMSFTFLSSGLKLGTLVSHIRWVQNMSFIPGLLLIVIGLLRF
ncbi:membrane protein [Bacillus coahuilensis m2-6]|uniref:sporulation membrane protein YtaF n=1 Tax=Bacillus coahuilensis TaxID=408580 RepID=UPI00075018D6|nr:sporulation membrane protein YtaF [Bacillus coahuilensis]KUP06644.1 membrane protein [Bacillus coahuilensis m2-6]